MSGTEGNGERIPDRGKGKERENRVNDKKQEEQSYEILLTKLLRLCYNPPARISRVDFLSMTADMNKREDRFEALRKKDETLIRLDERFGQTIRKYRQKAGIAIVDLSRLLGITPKAVSSWENGRAKPDADTINRLCRLLELPVTELFSLSGEEAFRGDERELLDAYRRLDEGGRSMALASVTAMAEEREEARLKELKESFRLFDFFDTPAAAGAGCAFGDSAPGYTFARLNPWNCNSDAIVRVSGRSMEPVYKNGDYVYLQYTRNVFPGDDVVCSTADGAVIKRVGREGLYSVNPDYPFGIRFEDDCVRIIGKVTGIVQPYEFAKEGEQTALSELFAYQVKQRIKKI